MCFITPNPMCTAGAATLRGRMKLLQLTKQVPKHEHRQQQYHEWQPVACMKGRFCMKTKSKQLKAHVEHTDTHILTCTRARTPRTQPHTKTFTRIHPKTATPARFKNWDACAAASAAEHRTANYMGNTAVPCSCVPDIGRKPGPRAGCACAAGCWPTP